MSNLKRSIWTTGGALGVVALAVVAFGPPVAADVLHYDDVIITGSLCVGFDCVNGESFGYDTVKLKENNLRLYFEDTSGGSFPSGDWRIRINDTTSGGASYFAVEDATNARTPFRIESGAPNHALYVEDYGRVGLGTSIPYVELHIADGDTPTVRLDQDGSSGWTSQRWDMAGNETNFFVRDVTNGSKLSFRIQPNTPSSTLSLRSTGNVGIGTWSPDTKLHVSDTGTVVSKVESTDNGAVQIRLRTDSENRRILARDGAGNNESQIILEDNGAFRFSGASTPANDRLVIDSSGNVTIQGVCSESGQPGSCADYVFEPDYALMPLEDLEIFVAENKHLPNVPSSDEIQKSGVNLQHFQGRLLEKIEELVLYTLEQRDEIDALKQRLAEIEKGADAR